MLVESFTVSFTQRDGCVVVHIVGELDCATVPMLNDAIDALIAPSGARLVPTCIEFDLARLSFCGSAGTRRLLRFSDAARDAGITVTFTGARQIVKRVFAIVEGEEFPDDLLLPA